MPVIPVNKVVDLKRIIRKKMKGLGGGEAQGVADPQKKSTVKSLYRRTSQESIKKPCVPNNSRLI
jgi:hypothetical protein